MQLVRPRNNFSSTWHWWKARHRIAKTFSASVVGKRSNNGDQFASFVITFHIHRKLFHARLSAGKFLPWIVIKNWKKKKMKSPQRSAHAQVPRNYCADFISGRPRWLWHLCIFQAPIRIASPVRVCVSCAWSFSYLKHVRSHVFYFIENSMNSEWNSTTKEKWKNVLHLTWIEIFRIYFSTTKIEACTLFNGVQCCNGCAGVERGPGENAIPVHCHERNSTFN